MPKRLRVHRWTGAALGLGLSACAAAPEGSGGPIGGQGPRETAAPVVDAPPSPNRSADGRPSGQASTPAVAGDAAGVMSNTNPTRAARVERPVPGVRYVLGLNISSNTFAIDTSEGAVIVDSSRAAASAVHHRLLTADGVTRTPFIVMTHAHGDHTGGVALWRAGGARLVAHRQFPEFLAYQRRIGGFLARRSGAQFQFSQGDASAVVQAPAPATAADLTPDILFDDELTLAVGDTEVVLLHTPGETYDHLTVWVPKLKAAFVGDNFYESFPNMYTLRGTQPRWPLDYIRSIDRVLALEPEALFPSHGEPVLGRENVRRRLTRYRDAVAFVHDAVVAGMNAGKDVYTLMREVKLPPELDVGEGYGRVSWSVRGIYEGYVGWFKGDPAEMFGGPDAVAADLVRLAGGPARIAEAAGAKLSQGDAVGALHLTSTGLAGAPRDASLLKVRIAALEALLKASDNRNEQGWLQEGLRSARAQATQ